MDRTATDQTIKVLLSEIHRIFGHTSPPSTVEVYLIWRPGRDHGLAHIDRALHLTSEVITDSANRGSGNCSNCRHGVMIISEGSKQTRSPTTQPRSPTTM